MANFPKYLCGFAQGQIRRHRTLSLVGLGAGLLPLAGGLAQAQVTDRDTQEISHYTLTETGFAKYSAATLNLNKLGKSAQFKCDDDSESPKSLDQFVAKIDAVPGAKAAIQSAGMTPREYMVFSMSLLQNGLAAWGAEQGAKLPATVSKANVDFVRTHKAAIEKLGADEKDKCGKSGDDRDSGNDRDSGGDSDSEQ